nr:RecName: Full=Uncharacterized protein SPAC29A4.23 [Schizosaccharomyces pombe 972h-]
MKIDKAIFTNQFGVPLPSDNPYVALHDFVYDLEVAIPEDEFEAFKEQLANPRNSCIIFQTYEMLQELKDGQSSLREDLNHLSHGQNVLKKNMVYLNGTFECISNVIRANNQILMLEFGKSNRKSEEILNYKSAKQMNSNLSTIYRVLPLIKIFLMNIRNCLN